MNIQKINFAYPLKNNFVNQNKKVNFTSNVFAAEASSEAKQKAYISATKEFEKEYLPHLCEAEGIQRNSIAIIEGSKILVNNVHEVLNRAKENNFQDEFYPSGEIKRTYINYGDYVRMREFDPTGNLSKTAIRDNGKITKIEFSNAKDKTSDLYIFDKDNNNSLKTYSQGMQQKGIMTSADVVYNFENGQLISCKQKLKNIITDSINTQTAEQAYIFKSGALSSYAKNRKAISNFGKIFNESYATKIYYSTAENETVIRHGYEKRRNSVSIAEEMIYDGKTPVEYSANYTKDANSQSYEKHFVF